MRVKLRETARTMWIAKVLLETNGDMEAERSTERSAGGIAKVDKKSGRMAAEGLIGRRHHGHAVVIELNSRKSTLAASQRRVLVISFMARSRSALHRRHR